VGGVDLAPRPAEASGRRKSGSQEHVCHLRWHFSQFSGYQSFWGVLQLTRTVPIVFVVSLESHSNTPPNHPRLEHSSTKASREPRASEE